jgi:hypothetical protein
MKKGKANAEARVKRIKEQKSKYELNKCSYNERYTGRCRIVGNGTGER